MTLYHKYGIVVVKYGGFMTYSAIILLAAKKAGISGALLLAICSHESQLENVAVMNDGNSTSYGICQVKLATAQQMGFRGIPETLMIPKENAKWAALYLKYQLKRYHGNVCRATAAYNSGTFRENEYHPGMPKNIHYLRCVMKKLPKHIDYGINCFDIKYTEAK